MSKQKLTNQQKEEFKDKYLDDIEYSASYLLDTYSKYYSTPSRHSNLYLSEDLQDVMCSIYKKYYKKCEVPEVRFQLFDNGFLKFDVF